jgi:cardiolipin synthase
MTHEKSLIAPKKLEIIYSGEDYFSRLEAIIHQSQFEVHIQIYIFENDATGNRIMSELIEAASRGVKIFMLLDAIGSLSFPSEKINELKKWGIFIRFFAPLLSSNSFYLGRRLHQKVVVADAKVALIGGINIADKYCGTPTEMPWLDYAIQLNDTIAEPLQELCRAIYFKRNRLQSKKMRSVFHTPDETMVRILQNDWLKRKNEICEAYIESISNAKTEIIIVGSYFLPGRKIIRALKKAAKNKVQIKLILSGISDIPMTRRASCYLYDKLLRHGIELYEWDKSVLHGKTAVIDEYWTTIGSFNLNNLSSYGSIEMNVEINSALFASLYRSHLNEIIAQCQKVTPELLKTKHNLFTKFTNWLSYCVTRIIELLITYTPYKRFYTS